MTNETLRRLMMALVCTLATVTWAPVALAQDPEPPAEEPPVEEEEEEEEPAPTSDNIVTPTAAQLEINDKAVQSISDGLATRDPRKKQAHFESAIKLFIASNEIQELNINYLNLGRSYQLINRCFEAEEALGKVYGSVPAVPAPSPKEIQEKASKYLADLRIQQTCMGELTVKCNTPGAKVIIDDGTTSGDKLPKICDGEAQQYAPGSVLVTLTDGTDETKKVVKVKPMERVTVEIELKKSEPMVAMKDPDEDDKDDKKDDKEPNPATVALNPPQNTPPQIVVVNPNVGQTDKPEEPKSRAAAWTFLAMGLAMAASGALWDTCFFQQPTLQQGRIDQEIANGGAALPGTGSYQDRWCINTYDGKFTGRDIGPPLLYLGGLTFSIMGLTRF